MVDILNQQQLDISILLGQYDKETHQKLPMNTRYSLDNGFSWMVLEEEGYKLGNDVHILRNGQAQVFNR